MTDSDFLKHSKILLKQIIKQRKWLIAHGKSYLYQPFALQEITNIQYALTKIHDSSTMKSYLHLKHKSIRILISSRNPKYQHKLNQLITYCF